MRFFAAINSDNIVRRVVTAGDDDNIPGCKLANGEVAWVECKQDRSIRANWPDVGSVYKPTEDVFCGLKPYPSWVFNTTTWLYESPTPTPPEPKMVEIDGVATQLHGGNWDEENQKWLGYMDSVKEGYIGTHIDWYEYDHVNDIWIYTGTLDKTDERKAADQAAYEESQGD